MPGACRPRQMLPPPTTTAGWMPRSMISASCRATSAVATSEIPEPESGAKASPESFSSTRWYVGRAAPPSLMPAAVPPLSDRCWTFRELTRLDFVLAQPVAGEALHRDLLAGLRADLVEEVLDRLRVVLHERLIEQDRVLQEGFDLALHDPRDHV